MTDKDKIVQYIGVGSGTIFAVVIFTGIMYKIVEAVIVHTEEIIMNISILVGFTLLCVLLGYIVVEVLGWW